MALAFVPIGGHGSGYSADVGYGDVLFFVSAYRYSGAIGRGRPISWKFDTVVMSLTAAPHPWSILGIRYQRTGGIIGEGNATLLESLW